MPHLGGIECRGMGSTLLSVPTPCFCSWLFRSGTWAFWFVCILLSVICSNCASTQLLLVPYSFTVFCCSRRCVFRCKHCSKGSQVPTCLMSNFPLFAVHPSPSPTTYVPPYNQEGQKDDEAVVWRIIQQAVRVQEL